jgi:hypothetical protein
MYLLRILALSTTNVEDLGCAGERTKELSPLVKPEDDTLDRLHFCTKENLNFTSNLI